MDFNLSKIKKVHLIGIGGIAVSADAKFLIGIGKIVTGSDARDSEIINELRKKGIFVTIGHKAQNIKKDIDLIIYSPAVPYENVERTKARKYGIREISHTEFLGCLSQKMQTVAVSGTNGKSTTTAMIGLILEKAGLDPTVIVGSRVPWFEEGNLRAGAGWCDSYRLTHGKIPPSYHTKNFGVVASPPLKKGGESLFVVEGCEYKAGMMELSPEMIVLTNIEEDHLDYYKNLAHIKRVFHKYVKKVENGGLVVYNSDDKNTIDVIGGYRGRKAGYGVASNISHQLLSDKEADKLEIKKLEIVGHKANNIDAEAKNVIVKNQRQNFEFYRNGNKLGEIKLRVPGIFNIYNAMAAATVALELGVNFKIIKKSLEDFKGIWRRFE
ncbi:MAG: Mur ligase family protein, partial [bacterium]